MSTNPPSSQPQQPGYTPTAPSIRQNGLALAALVLGIVSLFVNPILIASILAIVFGIIALRRAPLLGRRNMAIIGIVLAVIGAIVSIIVTSAIFGAVGQASRSISEISLPVEAQPSDVASTPADQQPSASASADPSEAAVPVEYRSALAQAQSYSDNLHLSEKGIYDQLTSDNGGQFPKKAAQYAIDNVDANYNENALEQAKSYQDNLNLSRNQIHDQLTSEAGGQFTDKQADYALDNLPK